MNESVHPEPTYPELLLARQYPAYEFGSSPRPQGRSYTAQAKNLGTRPWCVVTSDLADFPRELPAPAAQEA